MIEPLVSQTTIDALGWTLLHFLWQGALLALLVAGLLAGLARHSANARYTIACAAMVLMLVAPLATFRLLRAPSGAEAFAPAIEATVGTTEQTARSVAEVERPAVWGRQVMRQVTPWLSWLISAWLVGVFGFSLRFAVGWKYAHNLKTRGTSPINDRGQQTLNDMWRRFHLTRPVAILESTIAHVPMVIGYLHPVILLPTSVLTGLTPEQLRAVVAHELAHVRRHDYLANLLQFVVETLLFYHPAVWWLSQRIRDERENCCDDIAVAAHGDALGYARTLARLESLRGDRPQPALAATGGVLIRRIRRLVHGPSHKSNKFGVWLAGMIMLGAIIATGMQASLVSRFTDPQEELSVQYPAGSQEEKAAQAMNVLIKTLKGRNFEMKGEVEAALEQIRASGTIAPVLAALVDQNERTREKAAWALGNLADRRAVESLIRALKNGDWRGQHTVAWALGMIGDRSAVEALIETLKSGNDDARHGAAWALGKIGDGSAVEALIPCLKDDASDVRHGAAWALGMIGDPRAIEPLRAALNNSDSDVREAINQALAMLSRR